MDEQQDLTKYEKPKKLTSSEQPCKKCDKIKGRRGWYCDECRLICEKERHKKSGSKPHYIKRNCTDCDGERDRKGYLCSKCYEARVLLRKEVTKKYRENLREEVNSKLKDKQLMNKNKIENE